MPEETVVPDARDPTNVLHKRLDSWTSALNILYAYVESLVQLQQNVSKSLEKVKKTIADSPGFDSTADSSNPQTTGGIDGAFKLLRGRTDVAINKSTTTENSLKKNILPELKKLIIEVDKQRKALVKSVVKIGKDVDLAQAVTQRDIERLGSSAAGFATSTKVEPRTDPYIAHRLVIHDISDQVEKENNQIDAILLAEQNFLTMERHLVSTVQTLFSSLAQAEVDYFSAQIESFPAIANSFKSIPEDYEWQAFCRVHQDILIKPDHPKRKAENITFSNQSHGSVEPLIEGVLQRKEGTLMKKYESSYFVVTKCRYLHQFQSQDNSRHYDPEMSIYLPDANIGTPGTQESGKYKLKIIAKDSLKTLKKKHTFSFKASTYDELMKWYDAIKEASGIDQNGATFERTNTGATTKTAGSEA